MEKSVYKSGTNYNHQVDVIIKVIGVAALAMIVCSVIAIFLS